MCGFCNVWVCVCVGVFDNCEGDLIVCVLYLLCFCIVSFMFIIIIIITIIIIIKDIMMMMMIIIIIINRLSEDEPSG